MLAKKYRLSGPKDYKRVEDEGKIYQSSNFGVAFFNRADGLPSRFGFVVSTKIAKDAVDRNRFKRAMSEAVRTSSTETQNDYDVVFLAKTSIVRVPTSEVMKEVKIALKAIGIVK